MMSDMMEGYPLSPQQERVWLLQQGEPGMPYRAQGAIRIEGSLDLQVFTTALQQVVERHEILRTTFHSVPGMTLPVQVIGHPRPPGWHADDWCGFSSQEQAARLAAFWHEACQRPLDFAQGPLLQLYLTRLAPTQHRLLLRLPALCADRTTLINLVHDLSRAYAACMHNETLSDAPLQYVDFSAWQSALLTAEAGEADRAYWHKQLMADLLYVKLPGEQPLSGIGFTPGVLPVTLPPHLVAQIDAFVRQSHTSHAVFFLACWTFLLWRHLGQADTLVGMAYDGRNYEPLQDALGLFARYLPIRCALEAREPFSGLLERLYAATQEAYQRQEYFIWDNTGDQSDTGSAFFPLCFEFVEQPTAYVSAGVSFVIEQLDACTERFKVKLGCMYQDGVLSAALHYDAQAFQSETIAPLAEQLRTLLASASQHPEAMIGQLELLSDAERQRVLVTFNQTQAPEPYNLCLHHLFEAQTACTPDRIVAVYADQYLTYAALNARANQLAHHLQQLGVAPQVRVGLCLEGSLEMLVGIFGILKAGGAYVPLDPTYPRERLAFMATDVQASVLLTQARLLEGVTEYGPEVVCLDTEWEAIAQHSEANPVSEVTCGHLAYVIYTSGSTGQPKGVLVTHGNVVHSTQARLTYYRQPVSAFLLLSSFAFDSSVAGLFGTLCQGGTLILPGTGYQGDLGHLTTLIMRHHVSHLLSLPSLYALLLQQVSPSQLDSLHAVIVAGEACPRGLVTQHYERLPDAALFNEYGPTEGTVWSSVYPCQLQDVATSVPIGCPIANTQIYLLNTRLQPVPIGIPGEIYIGGAGVTIGYCNRAALTAERFLPHPFSKVAGARLYKTGDLGRYRPDGIIEFLGRSDQQVKIRGFRIELGEIETVLQEHPAITEAVVVACSLQHLVAYLVAAQNPPPSPNELRRFLQAKLPDYMVPSFFVWLEALPLAPNGKVDRQALPDVETLRSGLDATYVAPATEVERTLAMIWQEVLHVEKVGMHDNFFDLGGHSLAMVHVHSKLQESYRSDLSLVDLFRYPTISALVSYVSQQEHAPFAAGQSDARAEMRRGSIRRQRQLRQERRSAARAKGSA